MFNAKLGPSHTIVAVEGQWPRKVVRACLFVSFLSRHIHSPVLSSTQFCRIKGCGGAGCLPSIILERLKLSQQIIYRRKENFRRVRIIKNIREIF